MEFEHNPYLTVTAMSADRARAFGGELTGNASWFKTLCVGQSTRERDRFGARTYKLFRTEADWKKYQEWRREGRA